MAKGNIVQREVKINGVRLSFPSIFRPKVEKNDKGGEQKKYQATFLLDPKDNRDDIDAVNTAIDEVIDEKWGRDAPNFPESKLCLRDGKYQSYDGYAGMMYVTSNNTKRPSVVDRNKSPLHEDDGRPYAGCYVNAVIRVWAQDNDHGKRVNASLEAIQFVRDGEAFSGYTPVDTDEAFDDVSDDGDDRRRLRDDRGSRSRDEERGSRDRDERGRDDRGRDEERGSRDRDDRGSRSREDRDERGSRDRDDRGSRSRDDDDRGSRGGRERDDDRGSRSRDDEDRGRSRDRDDDRGRRR